ncbi:MAG: Threonine--tRNA ligase 2 [Chlamydiae bacterium]|nr:Threonine--tRNA ligase 2 [Chlamydiota bacterium]
MISSSQSQNQVAALLLGVAIRKSFPKEDYLGSGVNRSGFYADFTISGTFHETYLPLLETAMKKESLSDAHEMEMVASNAQTFFIHKKEKGLAEKLESTRGTVRVVQMGDFVDLYEYPLVDPAENFYFTLFHFEKRGETTRVLGRVFSTDKERKTFLKKWRAYPKKSHEALANEMELYSQMDGTWVWHSRGIILQNVLKKWWANHLQKWGIFEVGIEPEFAKTYAETRKERCIALWSSIESLEEDLFPIETMTRDSVYFFFNKGEKEKNRTTCLFCVQEFCQRFGLEEVPEDSGSSHIQIPIYDALGRKWPGPQIKIAETSIEFTLFSSLERFIALLLERFEGDLPFWLAPEQVRVLPLKGVDLSPVEKIFSTQQIRASFDESEGTLAEKMHRALRTKVPYVIVFGKREEQAGRVTVRAYGERKEETLTLEQFEALLVKRKSVV